MIRGAIFDLGSTLLHFDGDWSTVLQESRDVFAYYLVDQQVGIEFDSFSTSFKNLIDKEFLQRQVDNIERPLIDVARKTLRELGVENASDEVLALGLVQMYAISEAHWKLDPSAREVLTTLVNDGLGLGLISNAADVGNVQRLIDKANIRSFFEPILISAGVGIRKPDVRIFDMLLEEWDFPPHEVVMIGDSLKADILGGQRAGMHQIWINHKNAPPPTPTNDEPITPEIEINDLSEVPHAIQQINREY